MSLRIISNNHRRPLLTWWELTDKQQQEWDILDNPEEYTYFVYKDWTYLLADFCVANHEAFEGWDGYMSDSFFSGVLINLCEDNDYVKVGWYYT